MDSSSRSIAKAASYRLLGSLTTALIFFILSNEWKVSLGAGLADAIVKMGLYFLHERLWNHIEYGRPKPPEYEI